MMPPSLGFVLTFFCGVFACLFFSCFIDKTTFGATPWATKDGYKKTGMRPDEQTSERRGKK